MKSEKFQNLDEKIKDYFLLCDAVNEERGKLMKPYTMSGLLCHIGLSREEFEHLSSIKRHSRLIQSTKAKIESFIEENALTGALSCNASLNSLKNSFGWGEKQDKRDEDTGAINITLSPEMQEIAR